MICGDEGEGLGWRLTPTPTENIESSAVVKIQVHTKKLPRFIEN